MAKFAKVAMRRQPAFIHNLATPDIRNVAGGEAFALPEQEAIATLVLNSFLQEQYYATGEETTAKLVALCQQSDPYFLAQLALTARHVYGMRSTSHVIAGELATLGSGTDWIRPFFEKIVGRPDDMLEIAAYALASNGRLSNALKVSFAKVLSGLSEYHLMKYKGAGTLRMVDLINLTHPNSLTVDAFMKGTLAPADTWETKLSAGGDKGKVWEDLLKANKLGYLATLRNLRNISQSGNKNALTLACALIMNFGEVQRSKIFPFQLYGAFVELEKARCSDAAEAVMTALELSLANVPAFPGKTLIALDSSGSMGWGLQKNQRSVLELAAIYAAALMRTGDATLIQFDHQVTPFNYRRRDSLATTAERLIGASRGGGTAFETIFGWAGDTWYDRFIIISDMQSWIGRTQDAYRSYATRHNALPFVHNFDLCGLGTAQFGDHTASYGAYSANVLSVMAQAETSPRALVEQIASYSL